MRLTISRTKSNIPQILLVYTLLPLSAIMYFIKGQKHYTYESPIILKARLLSPIVKIPDDRRV